MDGQTGEFRTSAAPASAAWKSSICYPVGSEPKPPGNAEVCPLTDPPLS